MTPPERFDEGPGLSGPLPELPIPRPAEGPNERAPVPAPLSQPRLGGGGASFTAASENDPPVTAVPEPRAPLDEDVELIALDKARLETERFTWDLAARLTAGMLANPARNHTSVKDAMAMFDQFLHEMHSYSQIASEFDVTGDRERRRRDHTEYFQGNPIETVPSAHQAAAPHPVPVPPPLAEQHQQHHHAQQQAPSSGPAQPRPAAGYQALPPGARSVYVPGSMAGAPPDPSGDDEADVA